jgi:hypothetical protein
LFNILKCFFVAGLVLVGFPDAVMIGEPELDDVESMFLHFTLLNSGVDIPMEFLCVLSCRSLSIGGGRQSTQRKAQNVSYKMQLVNVNFDYLKNYSHLDYNSALNILK